MKLLIRLAVGMALVFAAIAIVAPSGCACTSKVGTYRSAMKSDLRIVARAEVDYEAAHHSYTTALQDLKVEPTSGVRMRVLRASRAGFYAVALHDKTDEWRCMVAVGVFTGDSLRDGEPKCQLNGEPPGPRSAPPS
jgi:hypothetical protein